jgi:hypothetical protein
MQGVRSPKTSSAPADANAAIVRLQTHAFGRDITVAVERSGLCWLHSWLSGLVPLPPQQSRRRCFSIAELAPKCDRIHEKIATLMGMRSHFHAIGCNGIYKFPLHHMRTTGCVLRFFAGDRSRCHRWKPLLDPTGALILTNATRCVSSVSVGTAEEESRLVKSAYPRHCACPRGG